MPSRETETLLEAASNTTLKVNMLHIPAKCVIVVLCVLTLFFFFGCLPSFAKTPWLCFKSKRSGVGRQFRNQKWGADDCSLRDVVSLLSFSTSCTSIQEGTGRCKALSWWVLRKTASEAAEKTFWPRIYLFFHTVTSPLSSLLLLKCLHNDHIEFVTALKSYPG